jgi:hypothetical protein
MFGHSWNMSGASQQRSAAVRLAPSSNIVTLAQPREPTILSPVALLRCTSNAVGPLLVTWWMGSNGYMMVWWVGSK